MVALATISLMRPMKLKGRLSSSHLLSDLTVARDESQWNPPDELPDDLPPMEEQPVQTRQQSSLALFGGGSILGECLLPSESLCPLTLARGYPLWECIFAQSSSFAPKGEKCEGVFS
jgi:hypothetical protein